MKLLTAILTFSLIFGGWWLLQNHLAGQAASAPLPSGGHARESCALWFIGSSSIARWDTLERDMKPWHAHNRGIDGALFKELAQRFAADPEKTPPDAIILYAGENDIAAGGTAEQAVADLKLLLDDKSRKFGITPTFVISVKPSPARWSDFAAQGRYNMTARALAEERNDVRYVDVVPPLLVNGRPGPFYVADGIHMNEAGYRIWAGAIRMALDQALSDGKIRVCDPVFSGPGGPGVPARVNGRAAPADAAAAR